MLSLAYILAFCVSWCRKTNFIIVLSNIDNNLNLTDLQRKVKVCNSFWSNVVAVISVFQHFHCLANFREIYLAVTVNCSDVFSYLCKLSYLHLQAHRNDQTYCIEKKIACWRIIHQRKSCKCETSFWSSRTTEPCSVDMPDQ